MPRDMAAWTLTSALVLLLAAGLPTATARRGAALRDITKALVARKDAPRALLQGAARSLMPEWQVLGAFSVGGATVHKVQQTHLGLPVFGHTFTVGLDAQGNHTAEHSFGQVLIGLAEAIPDRTPQITAAQALNKAVKALHLATNNVAASTSELNIYYLRHPQHPSRVDARLAFMVTLSVVPGESGDGIGVGGFVVVVDALSGDVLTQWPTRGGHLFPDMAHKGHQRLQRRVLLVGAPLPARATEILINGIGGNLKTGPLQYDGQANGTSGAWHNPTLRVLKDADNRTCYLGNSAIWTQTLNNSVMRSTADQARLLDFSAGGPWGGAPFNFTCPGANESLTLPLDAVNGGYSPLIDLHASATAAITMYKDWYGTDVIARFEAVGVPVPLRVGAHFGPKSAYANAFFSGAYFAAGDGDPTIYPFTTSDTVAHELSHGVTAYMGAGLIYTGQSGSMNEAFSDMASAALQGYLYGTNAPPSTLFTLGGLSYKANRLIRNMMDPSYDRLSISCASSAYPLIGEFSSYEWPGINSATGGRYPYWYPGPLKTNNDVDVHFGSGVYNKAFYLLATSQCWDVKLAFQVFLAANQRYWTAQSTWLEGYYGVRFAALEAGFPVTALDAAFESVCVISNCDNSQYELSATSYRPQISGIIKMSSYLYNDTESGSGWCKLLVMVADSMGDYDLVVDVDALPTTSSYKCRASSTSGGPIRCELPAYPGSTYIIGFIPRISPPETIEIHDITVILLGAYAPIKVPTIKCPVNMACAKGSDCASKKCVKGYCKK